MSSLQWVPWKVSPGWDPLVESPIRVPERDPLQGIPWKGSTVWGRMGVPCLGSRPGLRSGPLYSHNNRL